MMGGFGDFGGQAECRQAALCPAMLKVSQCPREGLVGWEGLDSVIGGSRRGRDDRGRGRGGPGRGRDSRGRHSGGRGPASGGRYDQEQGRPQDFDGGGLPGRYSCHFLMANLHQVTEMHIPLVIIAFLRLCNCERVHAKGLCIAWHLQWHLPWGCVLFLSRRLDLLNVCAAWTAEEQEGKAQTATRPHPQEVMGVQAGGVVTCAVTAAEASVIGVEGLPEEVVSLQGGVAEIGAEDRPGAAGTRFPESVLS